jgi:hypothetical protein
VAQITDRVALGMNPYSDLKQREEVGAFAQILTTRSSAVERRLGPASSEHRGPASLASELLRRLAR